MNRVERHFSRATRQNRRTLRLPSAPEAPPVYCEAIIPRRYFAFINVLSLRGCVFFLIWRGYHLAVILIAPTSGHRAFYSTVDIIYACDLRGQVRDSSLQASLVSRIRWNTSHASHGHFSLRFRQNRGVSWWRVVTSTNPETCSDHPDHWYSVDY